MKKILFLLLIPFAFKAQKKTEKISEKECGLLKCQYARTIDFDKGDTTKYIRIGFQNARYSTITDIKSLFFMLDYDTAHVRQFVKDLKQSVVELDNKTQMTWTRKRYELHTPESGNYIFVREANGGNAYTTIYRKDAIDLIEWLASNGFK